MGEVQNIESVLKEHGQHITRGFLSGIQYICMKHPECYIYIQTYVEMHTRIHMCTNRHAYMHIQAIIYDAL